MSSFLQQLKQKATEPTIIYPNEQQISLMLLEQLSVLEVSGNDAATFLQNLLTNDVTQLTIGQGQYAGFCNPKGRLLTYLLVIRRQETGFQLILPTTLVTAIQKRLTMYVLRSKVTITEQSNRTIALGLCATNEFTSASLQLNDQDLMGQETDATFTIKIPSTHARWLVLLPSDSIEHYFATLQDTDYQLTSPTLWEIEDIDAGIAKVTVETQEKFTPQQLNLDLNNSVSFKKGCYPGQEVVARLHYLGKPSRRLFNAIASSNSKIEMGSEIKTEQNNVAGHVVNAQMLSDNEQALLLSLKLSEVSSSLQLSDGTVIDDVKPSHIES